MTTTYDTPKKKTKAINACVSDEFYEEFAKKAAEVPGRTPTEYARQLCERAVQGEPSEVTLLAELLALRRIVVRGLLFPEVEMTRAAVAELLNETDAEKVQKARVRLALSTEGTR